MARPLGSRNRATNDLRSLLDRLERRGRVDFANTFARLYAIALDPDPENYQAAISAARCLLQFRFGLPKASVELVHRSASAEEILLRLIESEEHQRALARVEEHRRQLAAVTVTPEQEVPDA